MDSLHNILNGRRTFILLCSIALGWLSSMQAGPTVTITWDPNPEADISGYRLKYGTSSGNYTSMLDAGSLTSGTVSNLAVGTAYFFAVTAYNTLGLESAPSPEISFTLPAALPRVGVASMVRGSNGAMQLTLTASNPPSGAVHVYYSDDLVNWNWLSDANLTAGSAVINDPGANTVSRRYYRFSYTVQ